MHDEMLRRFKELLSEMKPDLAIAQLATEYNIGVQEAQEIIQNVIGSLVKTKLLVGMVRDLEKNKPPLEKINVTDLTFPCLRHAYFAKKLYPEQRARFPEIVAMWIGTKLHETKIFERNEVEVEFQGVYGRVDGYEEEVILELKTTRNIPAKPYPHHVKQVSYYRVLLERNGYPVKFAVILYVNVNSLETKSYIVLFDRSLEDIEKELIERKNMLEKALKENKIPPPRPEESWACDYCSFAYMCGVQIGKEKISSKNQQ
ncbi:MAG: Dna2/Cas4 domain-containing protein [Candidatus Njordarchaeota archaeon]